MINLNSVFRRADFKIKAVLLLLLVAALLTLLDFMRRFIAPEVESATTRLLKNTLNTVHQQGLPRGTLGFVSAGGAQLQDYYYAQYALAPRLVRPDAKAQWVLCRFQNKTLLAEARRAGRLASWIEIDFAHALGKEEGWNPTVQHSAQNPLLFVRDCGGDILLFRRWRKNTTLNHLVSP